MSTPPSSTTLFDDLAPQSVHCASLTETEPGTLLAACYAFSYETSPDSRIVTAWFDGTAWSESETLIDYPGVAVGNPVLYTDAAGKVHLFFVVVNGDAWVDARVAHASSVDGGRSWSEARLAHVQFGLMTKARPLEIGTRLVVPIYDEVRWCSHVLVRESGDAPWRLFGDTTARGKTLQPVVVPRHDGRLDMYSRGRTGRIFHALSVNGGFAWTASQATDLPNPDSGIEVLRTEAGALLLISNPSETGRERLAYQLSSDDGHSWTPPAPLDEVEGELSYPYAICDASGTVQVLYTRQRTEVVHVAWKPDSVGASR